MEIRLTFIYNGVEVNLTTQEPFNLAKDLKDLMENLDQGLGQKIGAVTSALPVETRPEVASTSAITGNLQERIQAFASQVGIDLDRLKEIVHFGEDYPLLLKSIATGPRTKQQARALLALGAILDLVYQKPEVGSELYGKLLRDSSVDNTRLDNAMYTLKGKFIGNGSGRGRSYEITVPGRKEGLEVIKELAQPST